MNSYLFGVAKHIPTHACICLAKQVERTEMGKYNLINMIFFSPEKVP